MSAYLNVVTAVSLSVGILYYILKGFGGAWRKARLVVETLDEVKAHTNEIADLRSEFRTELAGVRDHTKELFPNHGSSLRDAVDQTLTRLEAQDAVLERLQQAMEHMLTTPAPKAVPTTQPPESNLNT